VPEEQTMAGTARHDAASRAAPAGRPVSPLRALRILYVDDDPLLRLATKRMLRRAGATCLPAGSHAQALALAAGDPHLELAILDFHMPDGCVGRLVERLKIVRPALPLIGTSGAERRRQFAQLGVTWFLEKPWKLRDLACAVEALSGATPHVPPAIPLDPCISGRFLPD
jgi:CheY-like chemotaxis protein